MSGYVITAGMMDCNPTISPSECTQLNTTNLAPVVGGIPQPGIINDAGNAPSFLVLGLSPNPHLKIKI